MSITPIKLAFAGLSLMLLSACGNDKSATATPEQSQEPAPVAATSYKVGVETPYPPYVQLGEAGKYEGFDVDILTEIGRREGFAVDIQPRAWDGIHELLNTKELDIVASGGFDTEERRAKYAFSQPYNIETVVLITQDNNTNSFHEAKGRKITYVSGSAEEYLAQGLSHTNTLDEGLGADNAWESIQKLVQKKADFAINTSSIYGYYAKRYPDQNLRVIHQDNPEQFNVAFAVQQNNTELLAKINNGLNAIRADGTYDKIKSKWFATSIQ